MPNSKARCPVCGRLQFLLIPGSECYCACGTCFLVGAPGNEHSLRVLRVPASYSRSGAVTIRTISGPSVRPTGKTNRFT